MSLILEALRKSEAERQLGRAPGLLSPMPSAPRRRNGWLIAAIGLPLLLAVAAAGWWAGRGGRVHDAPPAVVRTPDAEPAPGVASEPAGVAPAPVADERVAAERAAPTPPRSPAPPRDARRDAAVPASGRPAPTTPTIPTATELAPAPAVSTPSAAARPASARPDAPTEPPAPIEPAQAAPTAAAEPAPPDIALLDAAARSRLPPLRISLHVFAEQPAQRFALIDGRRVAEGQSLADGVTVDEIRRDGVVLAIDGRRYLLRRP